MIKLTTKSANPTAESADKCIAPSASAYSFAITLAIVVLPSPGGPERSTWLSASPRRLAAHVRHVWLKAEDKAVQQKLMPVSVGLTAEGQATPALLKKLTALGADASAVAALRREKESRSDDSRPASGQGGA
jgi:hypothetical protein